MATAIMKQKEVPELDDVAESFEKTVLTNGVRHKSEPG